MTKKINDIYLEFIEYYNSIEGKLNNIYNKCEEVDWLYEHINENLLMYFYNRETLLLNNIVTEYFEKEDFLKTIVDKIKNTNNFVFDIYYNVLEEDNDSFSQYIMFLYYLSILEDYIIYLKNKELDYDSVEQEILELKEFIYNKVELVDEFNDYLTNKVNELIRKNEGFVPSIFVFNIMDKVIHTENDDKNDFINNVIEEFNNNVTSFEDLYSELSKHDLKFYNKVLKLETVIRRLIFYKTSNTKLFDNNNNTVICALIVELSSYYNTYLTELHRIYDLYGIEYVVKYQELIRGASLITDIIKTYGDIKDDNYDIGDNFLGMYQSILDINMDDFEQFVDGGNDLIDIFCEEYDLITNKLEEQIEFLYNKFTKK